MKISHGQFHGEGNYSDVQRQSIYDYHTLALSHAATLNAWDRVKEVRKIIEPFSKIIQYPKEIFIDFFYKD